MAFESRVKVKYTKILFYGSQRSVFIDMLIWVFILGQIIAYGMKMTEKFWDRQNGL